MWDEYIFKKLGELDVPEHMLNRSKIGFMSVWAPIKRLLEQKTIPENGWNDEQIELFMDFLHNFDSDKDPDAIRIGEREGRISTPLLSKLCGGFCHGIGRSGNLNAPQPKAAGASLMQNLTNRIVLSLIKKLGIPNIKSALTAPFGTGMSLALSLRGLYNHYNIDIHDKNKVIYCRADHKSPIKGIEFIGLEPLIVEGRYGSNKFAREGVHIPMEDIISIYEKNKDKIGAIISTTSFFAPRVPDDVKEIAKFAQENNLVHIINNAYGLQSSYYSKMIRSAIDAGRVDAVVQSTDKNFLTPVGGAVIISPKKEVIMTISGVYAGRANASPVLHLLVSLLHMGYRGYIKMIEEQRENRKILDDLMHKLADDYGGKIIECNNPVSCVMSLDFMDKEKVGKLGGYLYNLRVTGPRIVIPDGKYNFGMCTREIDFPYLVINSAIGAKRVHVEESVNRVRKAFKQLGL